MFTLRLAALALGLAASAGIAAVSLGGSGGGAGEATPPAVTWKEIERLKSDQKYAEALARVESLRSEAQAKGRITDWTKALLEAAELRGALGEFVAAIDGLRRAEWPHDDAAQAALSLHLGAALRQYLGGYSWEIRQRERVAGEDAFDLATATAEQIADEAVRAYAAAWSRREALAGRRAGELPGITKGTYPLEIRGTLRDSLSYLLADLLADTSLWTPEQLFERDRLGVARLAGPEPPAVAPDVLAEHPLSRAASVLADLERWHHQAGRRGAELEALLQRTSLLAEGLESEAEKKVVREALAARLPTFRKVSWWSEGMATLARIVRESQEPGSTAKAHALATQGASAYPGSSGARRCAELAREIEAPEYSLGAMATDAPGKRSIEVTHRNLARLHFRAFAVDLEARLATVVEQEVWPSGQEIQRLVSRGRPAVEWTADLPPTPDFESHRTFLTPPISVPGAYLVVASADSRFGERDNRLQAVRMLLSDLVLIEEGSFGPRFLLRAVSGSTGKPASGAEVTGYQVNWRQPARRFASARAGSDGLLELPAEVREDGGRFLLLGRWNGQLALRGEWRATREMPPPSETLSTLLFTDRALYRPGQSLKWKGLVYRGRTDSGPIAPVQGYDLVVSLLDSNGEVVASAKAATNSFGTASGELVIPSGRLLGGWRLSADPNGSAEIWVEEYKRPTFEVELLDADSPLRLNRAATLHAEARYLFGLPLPEGRATWRVEREPVLPPWLFWFSGKGICYCFRFPLDTRTVTVASGVAPVGADGRLEIGFTPLADAREKGSGLTYRYRVSVEVTDAGGETRTASRSFRLGWSEIEARLELDGGFVAAGAPAGMAAIREDLDGVPRAGRASWRLMRLAQPEVASLPADRPAEADGDSVEERAYETPGDRLRPRWARDEGWERVVGSWRDGEEVARGALVHGADGRAAIALPALAPGAYRILYSTPDAEGETAEARRDLLVAGGEGGRGGRIALPALLVAERPSVRAGGTARLLVHSGLPGQTLYFDLFRDGKPLRREMRIATDSPAIVELPVGEIDRGGFAVRLTAVADHQLLVSDLTIDVPRDDRELRLELTTFRDLLEPGQRESWRVSVRDPSGEPLGAGAAELLASMYDRSLDLFRPFSPPAPHRLFPGRAGAPPQSTTLGPAERGGWWGRGWETGESVEIFVGDFLTSLSGYGIGGPAGRYLQATAAMDGVRGGMMAIPPPAPRAMKSAAAPAARAEQSVAETIQVAGEAVATPVASPVALRSDFAETAFFQPHLLTGSDGSVAIEFQVPEALTTWRLWLSAVTRELAFGSLEAEAKTRKELMVRPYLPRFLREGDEARIEVVVNNASGEELGGEATLAVRDAESGEDLAAAFGLAGTDLRRGFRVAAGGGESLEFRLVAPRRLGRVAVEVTARAGGRSDGERRPLPVLPARVHLVQSRFAALRDAERRELDFPDLRQADPTRVNEKLVVTVDGQLFAGMLAALPYLADYPYECTEQTLNRFLSTGMVESLFERRPELAELGKRLAAERETPLEPWKANDPNRRLALEETPWLAISRGGPQGGEWLRVLDPQVARAERESAIARLRESQLPSGAFPWFPGGPPSPYMTLYLMYGFAKASEFGVPVPRDLVEKGWGYVARDFREHWLRDLRDSKRSGCCHEYLTFLGYVASSYPDPSWAAAGLSEGERREILDHGFAHWRDHSPMLKLMLSMTLERAGRHADAKRVLGSVFDSAKTTRDEGTFWMPEARSWLWYEDSIETHAWALRALLEVDPGDPRRDGLVQWLFLNRQLNHWKSTRATAEVLYSVARHLEKEGTLLAREVVQVAAAGRAARFVFEPERFEGTARQLVVPGEALAATSAPTVTVEKETKGLAFASATWSFSTEQPPATGRGDLFAVERRYFRRVRQGRETVLEPLATGARLAVGDELEVQLSLTSRMGAEYVHLRDPRAAGLEPDRPDSGWRWDLGVARYEESRDSATNFFFEQLPVGEYTLKYRLRAATAGVFKVGPATVQSMYAPEFAAYSGAATLSIASGQKAP